MTTLICCILTISSIIQIESNHSTLKYFKKSSLLVFGSQFGQGKKHQVINIFIMNEGNQFMRKRSKGLAEGIMVIFWLIYVFLILSIYECNLRANLASVPLERVINDENDIVDLGQEVVLPTLFPIHTDVQTLSIRHSKEVRST